jgi:hypothetical protein
MTVPDNAPRSPLRVFGAVALVALLYAASMLAWWLTGRHSATASDSQVAYQGGAAGAGTADPLAIADLAGAKENLGQVRDLPALAGLNFLTSGEIGVYQDGAASAARIAVSDYPDGKATVILVELADLQKAARTEQELVALQHGYGLTDLPSPPPWVTVVGFVPAPGQGGAPLARAVYRRGDVVARIEFRGSDPAAIRARLGGALDAELKALPADA